MPLKVLYTLGFPLLEQAMMLWENEGCLQFEARQDGHIYWPACWVAVLHGGEELEDEVVDVLPECLGKARLGTDT